ncbi:aminoglycoside phosphotransferase family protein [Tabrizicola sp. J26]|uniref:phosphotransferase enzyme family protein n=1 Tax=Alitabrizicola rongguiensis TaxID=2909234 RepID=UPI001F29DD6B|nr:aminoglycoside phosphotransferase family protein [Tabrizicola rongguiensis]MCF1710094.1 aminoglycoside phosphotransferase family protein [Tabrizicola rongguiensis]
MTPPARIDPPDLSAFGTFRVLGPMVGGRRATVWRVEDDMGRLYVARSTRRSEAQLRWVLSLMRLARQAGFRVAPYRTTLSGAVAPAGWTLEPFLDGRGAGVAEMRALAPRIRAFHDLTAGIPQRPGFASCLDLVTGDRGGDVDLSLVPVDLATEMRATWEPFLGRPTAALHGDLGPGNVLMAVGGPALIDWDEARCDLPLHDLATGGELSVTEARAHLAFEIATSWRDEPDYARELLGQFRPVGFPDPPRRASRVLRI